MHIGSLNSVVKDTIVVQKESYFLEGLPSSIANRKIDFQSENEINRNIKKDLGFIKVFPIEVKNGMLIIRIVWYGYSKERKIWVFTGGNYYYFKYDCDEQKFVFFEKVNYGI